MGRAHKIAPPQRGAHKAINTIPLPLLGSTPFEKGGWPGLFLQSGCLLHLTPAPPQGGGANPGNNSSNPSGVVGSMAYGSAIN
jgi:hypothetical protein